MVTRWSRPKLVRQTTVAIAAGEATDASTGTLKAAIPLGLPLDAANDERCAAVAAD